MPKPAYLLEPLRRDDRPSVHRPFLSTVGEVPKMKLDYFWLRFCVTAKVVQGDEEENIHDEIGKHYQYNY